MMSGSFGRGAGCCLNCSCIRPAPTDGGSLCATATLRTVPANATEMHKSEALERFTRRSLHMLPPILKF